MGTSVSTADLPWILRETIVGLVRLDDADVTLRALRARQEIAESV